MAASSRTFEELAAARLDRAADGHLAGNGEHSTSNGTAGPVKQTSPAPPVELLLVAHLVRDHDRWIEAYARRRAEREGPGVLVQPLETEVLAGVVDADPAPLRAEANGPDASMPGGARADSIDEALDQLDRRLRATTGRGPTFWILSADGADRSAVATVRPPRVTLLTTADDLGTIIAYRSIRRLLDRWSADADAGSRPRVAVAFAEPDAARAHRALDRLRATTGHFLGCPLELATILDEAATGAGPDGSADLVRCPGSAETLVELAAALERRAGRASEAPGPEPDANGRPAPRSVPGRLRAGPGAGRPRIEITAEELAILHGPEEPATTAPSTGRAPSGVADVASAARDDASGPASGDEAEPAPSTTEPSRPASAAALIDGIEPIDLRCPMADSVELAVDAEGRLHAVAWLDDLAGLLVASAWCGPHGRLLAAADARIDGDRNGPPALHVVSTDATALQRLRGSDLALHLLVESSGAASDRPWVRVRLD